MTRHHAAEPKRAAFTIAIVGAIVLWPATGHTEPASVVTPPRASTTAALPAAEPEEAPSGSAGANPFVGKAVMPAAAGQTLTAPVTVTANSSADAMTVTQNGAGRAINGAVNSSSNALSAIKGITAGSGSGVNGVNSGTAGQAGKFEITNASSGQTGLLVTTAGTGSAVQAVVKTSSNLAAIVGQNKSKDGQGTGVEGDGGYAGVIGTTGAGLGVLGSSSSGYGTAGISSSSYGLYGTSNSGYGLYASSSSSYAGYFAGSVYASGVVTANSYAYTSDRDQKQGFTALDSTDVLNRIAAMPMTSWTYIARPAERHIGPMAQDFHAAFGLGADDKHIDVVDGIGVSLAAIKELQQRLGDKEARIAALESQVQDKGARIDVLESQAAARQLATDARLAALEQAAAAVASGAVQP